SCYTGPLGVADWRVRDKLGCTHTAMVRAASPTAEERRAAKRAATNRKAVVISADAAMPLFTGTAFDISRDGVGIRAYSRMSKGAAVDLEIEPRPDHEGDSL